MVEFLDWFFGVSAALGVAVVLEDILWRSRK